MKIAEIRTVIRGTAWTRNDLTGGTSEEFIKQEVGPRLQAKIKQLRALEIPARFPGDIARRDEEIVYCERVIARWQAAQPTPAIPAPLGGVHPNVTDMQMVKVETLLSGIAGEPVKVDYIKGTFYGFCSELGALRLEHKYNHRPHCEALYSENLKSWVFRMETML